jgi:membrane protein DedA with SNARE-associated domain
VHCLGAGYTLHVASIPVRESVDTTYWILLLLAAVTAIGIPGVGDSALVAAAILAAQGRLSLPIVLIFAFVGYLLGRAIGYRIGFRGGRTLMEHSGLLEEFRKKTIAKGDALFEKYPRGAPLAAPAPISGIHHVPIRSFAVTSIVTAAFWTLSTGLVAFFLGGSITDLLQSLGIKRILVIALIVAAVVLAAHYLWQRRQPSNPPASPGDTG